MKLTIKINIKALVSYNLNNFHGNIFQTPEMYEVYKNTKNYEPIYFAVLDDNDQLLGSLLAVIQKEHSGLMGKFSSRAIVWGGPIIKDNSLEVLDFILNNLNKLTKRKAIYTQFRNMREYTDAEKNVFKRNGFLFEEHLDIMHDLDKTDEDFFSDMHKGRRKNIRRAINKDLLFKEICNKEKLLSSLELIKNTYIRVKLPMPDISLFLSTYDEMYSKGMVKFFKASYENKIIGVRYVFAYNNLIYDWFAGTDNNHLDKYPNDFLPFKVMQWGRDNEYKIFQFGGAGKPDKPYGVRDYKLKFGGDLVNWGRFERINKPLLMKFGKLGFSLMKKMNF